MAAALLAPGLAGSLSVYTLPVCPPASWSAHEIGNQIPRRRGSVFAALSLGVPRLSCPWSTYGVRSITVELPFLCLHVLLTDDISVNRPFPFPRFALSLSAVCATTAPQPGDAAQPLAPPRLARRACDWPVPLASPIEGLYQAVSPVEGALSRLRIALPAGLVSLLVATNALKGIHRRPTPSSSPTGPPLHHHGRLCTTHHRHRRHPSIIHHPSATGQSACPCPPPCYISILLHQRAPRFVRAEINLANPPPVCMYEYIHASYCTRYGIERRPTKRNPPIIHVPNPCLVVALIAPLVRVVTPVDCRFIHVMFIHKKAI